MFSNVLIYPKKYISLSLNLATLSLLMTEKLRHSFPSGHFEMWHTFQVLYDCLNGVYAIMLDAIIKKPEKSLSKEFSETSQIIRKGSFMKTVDNIVQALGQGMIFPSDLAAIACEGNVQRNCSFCDEVMTVKAIFTIAAKIDNMPAVLIHPGQKNLFSCGKQACGIQMVVEDRCIGWCMAIQLAACQMCHTRCDKCFQLAPVKKVHRSECFTKYYCSKSCFSDDKSAHTVCCENLMSVDRRKWKKNQIRRRDDANEAVDRFVNHHSWLEDRQRTLLVDIASKMKKVKYKWEDVTDRLPEVD